MYSDACQEFEYADAFLDNTYIFNNKHLKQQDYKFVITCSEQTVFQISSIFKIIRKNIGNTVQTIEDISRSVSQITNSFVHER